MHKFVVAPFVLAGVLSIAVVGAPARAAAETLQVNAGGDLQAAINAAQPGDTIVLEAGATFVGNFVLPVKSGSAFITIRSSAPTASVPGPSSRVSPAHAALLPKIKSPNAMPALVTAPGTHHWRLVLLEFMANRGGYGEILQIGDGSRAQTTMAMVPYEIVLDRLYIHGDPDVGQKRGIALNAAAVTIRNCYISDIKAIGMDTQAIGGWNGPGPFVIENNYLEAGGENLMLGGADPAIPNLISENVTVRHNYFSRPMAWRDPIVPQPAGVTAAAASGGALSAGTYAYQVVARRPVGSGSVARSTASAAATVAVAADGAVVNVAWSPVSGATEYYVYRRSPDGASQNWTVTGTTFADSGAAGRAGAAPTSPGDRWLVKNIFELKNARNVLVEYNVFENNWAHGQVGYAIVLTPRNQDGGCNWCVVESVTFQYNVVRNVAGGINILGYDDLAPSQQTKNISVRHNVFSGLRRSLGGTAWFMLISDGPANVVVDHNTVDADGTTILYVSGGSSTAPRQVTGFQFTNNAMRHRDYGINGAHFGFGNGIITGYFPDGLVSGNWLQGGQASRYPANNYFTGSFAEAFVDAASGNYQPASGSILIGRAIDGTNIGADMATLIDGTKNVTEGTGSSKPSPPANLRIIK